MLIAIHMIQNHSPANLNRDDLGAPKTCYFGGVMRSRISSQCLKRSIRKSADFEKLCGGIRTRQLAKLIAAELGQDPAKKKLAAEALEKCGIKKKDDDHSDMLVYTTKAAISKIAELLSKSESVSGDLAAECGKMISESVAVPDMALSGRMLETGELRDTTVEASLQVAHAISTHEARSEVDYYVAADDIPGDDAGAAYVDEAMFASACFYKYFSIHWETLVGNLGGFQGNKEFLAAHTVGAFLRGAALANPTGKQNSFAAHNPPDGILVAVTPGGAPISYANAFANPVLTGPRDLVSGSIAQLGQYIHDLDVGYGNTGQRIWFSPNLRHPLNYTEGDREAQVVERSSSVKSLDDLIVRTVKALGYDWGAVQNVTLA